MKRRTLAGMLAMIMLVFSIQITAFAENEDNTSEAVKGDAVAIVEIDNPACAELENLGDLALVVGLKSDSEFGIEIPVKAVEMGMEDGDAELTLWLGYKEKAIEKEVLDYLANLQGDIFEDLYDDDVLDEEWTNEDYTDEEVEDSLDQMSALLNEVEISVNGLPEGHYTVDADSSGCMIITQDIVKEIISMIEEMIAMLYPEINFDEIEGFSGLVDAILAQEETTLDEVISMLAEEDPEFAEEIRQLFAEIDEAIAYMTSDEFPGLLIAGAYLNCECATVEEYEIVHEYYKNVDGELELVGYVYEGEPWFEDSDYCYLEGMSGQIVKASDFISCEYEGVTYEYVGSYNVDVMYEDTYYEYDWSEYELEEFVLGDEETWIDGLVLRYEIEGERDAVPENTDNVDDEGVVSTADGREAAPQTGDVNQLLIYLVLTVVSAGVAIGKVKKSI